MTKTGLPTLLAEIRSCRICEDVLPHGPRPVLQVGGQARILIAGQAPGRRVHESGVPFMDPSGDRLRSWMGLDQEAFYDPDLVAILPMGFCYPGTGPSGDRPPRRECAPAWREAVLSHLDRVELTLVLGSYALRYHLPGAGSVTAAVTEWRKQWPTLLPLPHPSPRNVAWFKKHPWFEAEVIPRLRARVREITALPPGPRQA